MPCVVSICSPLDMPQGLERGYFSRQLMPPEPHIKRARAFVDGQNLYHQAKEAYGYQHPNYDVLVLARAVCRTRNWALERVHFYTGIHTQARNPYWHHFWSAKLNHMRRQGIEVFSRNLRYRPAPEEKGIDVRIALDIIRLARQNAFDVALVFSQDQDLSEVADEIRAIARDQGRWIKIASAFPQSPASRNRRGINKTDWIPIGINTYNRCLDRRDFRPKHRL